MLYRFQNTQSDEFTLPGVDLIPLALDDSVSPFDLSFILHEHQQTVSVVLEYRRALFEATTIKRLMAHFQRLIEAILAQPNLPVSQLSI